MDKEDRAELKAFTKEIQDQMFNEFLENEDKTADKFKQIMKSAKVESTRRQFYVCKI